MTNEQGQIGPVGSMAGSALDRIRAIQAKAAMKQAAVDACQGHIWGQIYVSKIDHAKGSSAACIRCGERRAWTDIGPNEQWEHDTSLPKKKMTQMHTLPDAKIHPAAPSVHLVSGDGFGERTCATCKYKETAGQMVDPCFPCLHEHSICTGEPKAKYDAWTDERLSWDEVRQREQKMHDEIQRAFDELPELRELLAKLFPPNNRDEPTRASVGETQSK